MNARRTFLGTLALASGLILSPRRGLAGKPSPTPAVIPPLPVSIAVAEDQGRPVQDTAWIEAQMAEAKRLFEPLGIRLRAVSTRSLAPGHARLETRSDRDALVAALTPKQINVMIVASLRDVDDPSRHRMGVHWRNRKTPSRHYVIVAANAVPSVLAHELGHYFGLGHSDVVNNLMSYSRTAGQVFLDGAQEARILSMARLYVSTKLLAPVPDPTPPADPA